jgi:hypothetical protein
MNHCPAQFRLALPLAGLLAFAACGSGGLDAGDGGADAAAPTDADDHFSFFVTSLAAMQRLSGSQAGFGGDLRFGKADGLSGADEICRQIAEGSMPGAGAKGWRAFLSVTKGPDGNPVHAVDRIGAGPWYDRRGRLVALTKEDLIQSRPKGADPLIADDLPNEDGVPNHAPDGVLVDNHDILTGSDQNGRLYNADWSHTCHDWTSAVGSDGQPRVGHSWIRSGGVMGMGPGIVGGDFPDGGPPPGGPPPFMGSTDGGPRIIMGDPPDGGGRMMTTCRGPGGTDLPDGACVGGMGGPGGGESWISTLDEAGCAPGVDLVEKGPPNPANPTVGSGGGYGAIYCLASVP